MLTDSPLHPFPFYCQKPTVCNPWDNTNVFFPVKNRVTEGLKKHHHQELEFSKVI